MNCPIEVNMMDSSKVLNMKKYDEPGKGLFCRSVNLNIA